MVDALCKFHDMEYAYRKDTREQDDDYVFTNMLMNWAKVHTGDGWTGPTWFERWVVIPMIKTAFEQKKNVAEGTGLISYGPDAIKQFFRGYKNIGDLLKWHKILYKLLRIYSLN